MEKQKVQPDRFKEYCDATFSLDGVTERALDAVMIVAQAEVGMHMEQYYRDMEAIEKAKDYLRILRETGDLIYDISSFRRQYPFTVKELLSTLKVADWPIWELVSPRKDCISAHDMYLQYDAKNLVNMYGGAGRKPKKKVPFWIKRKNK